MRSAPTDSSSPGYPQAVLDRLSGFTESGFSFAVTEVYDASGATLTFSGSSIEVRGHLIDADGNPVTDGSGNRIEHGTFTLHPNGRFTVSYSAADLARQAALGNGETLSTAVGYLVEGERAGNTKSDLGQLVVTFRKNEAGELAQASEAWFATFGVSGKPESSTPSLFPDLERYVDGLLRDATSGGKGNSVTVTSDGALETNGTDAHGIQASSQGGQRLPGA